MYKVTIQATPVGESKVMLGNSLILSAL